MAGSWLDKTGLSALAEKAGIGTLIGIATGIGVGLLAMRSKIASGMGWLRALIVPAIAVIGGLIGGLINRDGPIFGDGGVVRRSIPSLNARDTYESGKYLDDNPDVREQLMSGEAPRKGKYKSAREHWEKFGKAEGRQWPSTDSLPNFNKPHNQRSEIAHIPVRGGVVNASAADFLGSVLDRNDGIVFADTKHENPAIPDFIKRHVPTLQAKGVTDIFIEADPSLQKHIDDYYRTNDMKHLNLLALAHRDMESADCSELVKACKDAGIRVHAMDTRQPSPKTLYAYEHKDEFIRENGKEAYDAAMQHFVYERTLANQAWVDEVKKHARGKYVLLGGSGHIQGYAGMQDVDEMLAAQRGDRVVHISLDERDSSRRIEPEITPGAKPWISFYMVAQDTPEFTIKVPGMHVEAYEAAQKAAKAPLTPDQREALQKKTYDLVNEAMDLRLYLGQQFRIMKTVESPEKARQSALYKLMEEHVPVYYQAHAGNFGEAAKGYKKLVEDIDKAFTGDRPAAIDYFRRQAQKLQTQCEDMLHCIDTPDRLTQAAKQAEGMLPLDGAQQKVRQEGKLLSEKLMPAYSTRYTSTSGLPIMPAQDKAADIAPT